MKINQLYEAKALDVTPVCPRERLVIISKLTGLSFALERIGPLATTVISVFYLLLLYLSAISKTPKNLSASVYSESLTKTPCQHLLLLVGFDTLIYQKYYDTPLYLWVITRLLLAAGGRLFQWPWPWCLEQSELAP